MSENPHELPRADWQRFLQELTEEHEGDDVTIELLDQELGDEPEVQKLPLAYVGYDPKDEMVIVAVGGRDRRFPVVMHHLVEEPRRILADGSGPGDTWALDVVAADGDQTIVTLHEPGP